MKNVFFLQGATGHDRLYLTHASWNAAAAAANSGAGAFGASGALVGAQIETWW